MREQLASGDITRLPEVSIIIPCFRCRDTLAATVEALMSQVPPTNLEILIVDSTDSTENDLRPSDSSILRVLRPSNRLLPGEARNLGAREALGSFVGFLDADALPRRDWLDRLRQVLEERPDVAMVGGSIGNANPLTTASRVLHWIEFSEFLPGTPSGPREHLSSCNLLFRRPEFLTAGGFDETYAMAEDLLFSRNFTGRIHFEGTARVDHVHRDEWPAVRIHLRRLGYWSGRLRRAFPVAGSGLRHFPLLAYGLLPYRLLRIFGRMIRFNSQPISPALVSLPGLIVGLFAWASGFKEGISGATTPEE